MLNFSPSFYISSLLSVHYYIGFQAPAAAGDKPPNVVADAS